jgi:chaperonin GroES
MIKPTGDRVLVSKQPQKIRSEAGILLPPDLLDPIPRGIVESVGIDAVDVQKGDLIAFSVYAGAEIVDGDQKYLLMRDDDILCIIK